VSRGPRFTAASHAWHIAGGYGLLASLATALAIALREGVPWKHDKPWMTFEPLESLGISIGLGIVLALIVIVGTRISVARFSWAQRLHIELRPIACGLTLSQIVLIAGFSSVGEELLFRGLLQPWIGLLPTSVLFGIFHQIPGQSRWVWVCWATFVGMAFGAIFEFTGSLVGPLIAHAVINAVNLAFLRDHDPMSRETADRADPA
jgi:membrane protease YdiL (CAAX protease family)